MRRGETRFLVYCGSSTNRQNIVGRTQESHNPNQSPDAQNERHRYVNHT